MDRKQSAKQRENYFYMSEAMRRLEWDLHHTIEATNRIPEEWHQIAQRAHPQPTERVTIRLDRDVLKFFRSMGTGYGPRLNEVLRSYMHARLAGVIHGADTSEAYRRPTDGARVVFGEMGAELGEDGPEDADRARERRAILKERMKARSMGKE